MTTEQTNPMLILIQERIKTMIINEMKDEDLQVFVSETFESFTKGHKSKRYQKNPRYDGSGHLVRTDKGELVYDLDRNYDPTEDPDTLPGIIHKGFQEFAKQKMQEYLQSEQFKTSWNSHTQQHKMNDNVMRSFLQQNAAHVIAEMMEKHLHVFLTTAVNQMKNNRF